MEKSPKKWSLGNILFRKSKKDIPQADFSSDDDDRKAGFGNDFIKKSPAKVKTNKQLVQGFDQQQYSVANPEFHYYKPAQPQQAYHPQQQQQLQYQRTPQIYQNNFEYINNQINLDKNRSALSPQYIYNTNNNYLQYQGSSQDEKSSYNSLSSPINKSGSENGSRTSLNKKTRSARNERYYQRIMRDEGRPQTVYGSVNSIENNPKYQLPLTNGNNRLSASLNSSSICSSEFQMPTQPPPMMMMTTMNQSSSLPITRGVVFRGNSNNNIKSLDVDDDKDDYENIHEVDESVPPPIPPRDPNRRFSINSSVSQNPYYFDQALQKYVIFNTNGKCFSDDKLWKHENEQRPTSARFNAVTDNKHEMNTKQQHDILRPRSRKPLNLNTNLDNECVFSSEDVVDNPRQYPISQRSKSAIDFEKMMSLNDQQPIVRNKFTQRQRNLTSVEPIKYQQMQNSFASEELQALRKKYTSAEDINNKNKVNMRSKLPTANTINTPGTRKSLNEMDLKVKENIMNSNLDDAINELETMYKNLVKDENLMERAARRDLPTPTKFTQLMRKYEEYENEENRNDKEPDILLDDVFSRNLKHANQKTKLQEHQPPFGIPNHKLYPIPPKPSQDYLSIEPVQMRKSQPTVTQNNPDVVADDLAVRNLRKDNPNYNRRRNMIEVENNHFMKRNHTLSSLSEHIYNGILKDSAKPSGGKLDDYLNFEIPDKKAEVKKDVKSTLYLVNKNPNEREDFEKSLNALVVESKAISQKLEKDLSKLKRESVTPKPTTAVQQPQTQPKTLVTLLDFRKSIEREKEKKSTSCSPIKSLQSPAGCTATSNEIKPQMTSTACSPIKDLQDVCPPKEEIIKSQAPKQQKTEKIENLIKMFNTTTMSSPEPIKKQSAKVLLEKPTRKLSDLSNMFEKAPEVDTKPPTQPSSLSSSSSTTSSVSSMTPYVKKTTSSSSIDEKTIDQKTSIKLISPRIVSPTVMNPKVRSVISPKKINPAPAPETTNAIKADVESNINNIKELIQQIKLTEFEKMNKRDAMKPDILKSTKSNDLPDYDNIKDDYEMTDGKLERISNNNNNNSNKNSNVVIETTESETKPTIITATLVIKPDFLPNEEPLIVAISKESSEIEYDENSPELKSITTTSSSLRETSVESSSKDEKSSSIENRSNNNNSTNNECADSAAIYKDAIEFLKENVDQKAITAATNEDDHKSPIKSMRQNKEAVLNYIGKINENLEAVKSHKNEEIEAAQSKMSVKESISKLEQKISLSRQNSEAISETNVSTASEASQYNTPPKEPSTPITIKPVVLPKVGPSDTESLYNSSEELSMIFGHAEQQQQQQNVQIHPGKIIEEDFEAEFEKIANDDEILDDKVLDENFNITLIDINNNTEYAECFDNELSDITNESAMSTKSDVSASNFFRCDTEDDKKEANGNCSVSDANNNSLTNELSKLNAECFTNTLMNRKPNPSTSKSSNNSYKSSSSQKSFDNNSCTATRSQQQQPLKTQCILLACLYCVMLYLQFIIFNFSKS